MRKPIKETVLNTNANTAARDGFEKIAAFMDMGTNSARLMIAGLTSNNSYSIISRQKEMIRLGEGEFEDGMLKSDAMERAVLVCRNFVRMAKSFNVDEMVAVATSATRDAGNQAFFLEKLKKEADLDVRVISGKEEARLIYLGVSSGADISGESLFMDIGGGSTELILGDEKNYSFLDSLKLGAIRLSMLYIKDPEKPLPNGVYNAMQRHVRSRSVRAVHHLKGSETKIMYGSSGTIQSLAEIARHNIHAGNSDFKAILRLKDLKQVVSDLCKMTLDERRNLPGMNPKRADIITAGAAILDTLMTDIGIEEIRISDRELRDGLLVDYLQRLNHPLMDEVSARKRSVLRLARKCNADENHSETVARIALELFDSAKAAGLHSQDEALRELLYYSAMLHDIGEFISYSRHHVSAYYFIKYFDLLGFTQDEVDIMAANVLFHRKTAPGKKHPEFVNLNEKCKEAVKIQSLFLRLAESLDRSHASLIDKVIFMPEKNNFALEIRSSKDCQLEIWGVEKHLESLEKVFKKSFIIIRRS